MRLRTLNADGSFRANEVDIPIRDETGELYDKPPVTIRVKMVSRERQREIQRASIKTHVNKRTRGTYREADDFEAGLTLLTEAIQSWDGILNEDDQPITVTPKAISELPAHVVTQVQDVILDTEAADDTAESFREPAELVRVVGE